MRAWAAHFRGAVSSRAGAPPGTNMHTHLSPTSKRTASPAARPILVGPAGISRAQTLKTQGGLLLPPAPLLPLHPLRAGLRDPRRAQPGPGAAPEPVAGRGGPLWTREPQSRTLLGPLLSNCPTALTALLLAAAWAPAAHAEEPASWGAQQAAPSSDAAPAPRGPAAPTCLLQPCASPFSPAARTHTSAARCPPLRQNPWLRVPGSG